MQLSIQNVSKHYYQHTAVDQVSIAPISEGRIVGLLGPNGAGKTSLMRMITRITMPDTGSILLDGREVQSYGDRPLPVGYMPEERGLYPTMKVAAHLIFTGQLKGLTASEARTEVQYWLERLEIDAWKNRKVKELSKGMQQKVQFIMTVMGNPQMLILDEPFTGLDPLNAVMLEQEIRRMSREKGVTVLLSTHRMEHIEDMCDQVVLLNKGKKVLDGGVKELRRQYSKNMFRIESHEALPLHIIEEAFPQTQRPSANEAVIALAPGQSMRDILLLLARHHVEVLSFTEVLPNFNDIFIEVVKTANQNNLEA